MESLAANGYVGANVTVPHKEAALACSAPDDRARPVGAANTLWLDGVRPNFTRLGEAFDPTIMDVLLLLSPTAGSIGYSGRGDFMMLPDGRLQRRTEREVAPFIYAGSAVLAPALFAGAPTGAFSLTALFDRAAEQERLFGLRLEGVWMHVGTPEAVAAADAALAAAS